MAQMEQNEAPPAAFNHLVAVYEQLLADSTETDQGRVYEGYMTKLVTEKMKLAIPYYTRVTQALKGMNCAKQLHRGGGSSASVWLLLKPPTLPEYLAWEQELADSRKPSQSVSQTAVLRQNYLDLTSRVETLETTISELLEALQSQ
jgi:hypothetical protein